MNKINLDEASFVYTESQIAFWLDYLQLSLENVKQIEAQLQPPNKWGGLDNAQNPALVQFMLNHGRAFNKCQMVVIELTESDYKALKRDHPDNESRSIYAD